MNKILFNENQDWTFPLLKETYNVIEDIALKELKLDIYPNQIEIIDSEQMLEAYTSVGMPNYYRHWSFGKSYESQSKQYKSGYSNLAYELVINCLSKKTKVYIKDKGIIPLSEVSIGDKIFDGLSFNSITNLVLSRKKTKRILLDDGTEIFATPEHIFPVITDNGKMELEVKDISIGNYLLSFEGVYPQSKTISYLHEFDYIPPMNGFGERFLFNPSCEIPGFMNENLAELMGVIIGDGSMSNTIGKTYYLNKYNSKRQRKQFLQEVNLDSDDQWLKQFRTVKIKCIEDFEEEDVIDITVNSKSHLFLANNILTHNCNPCISYLQENNSMTMQALVIAHACFGHNAVFKGNEFFRTWTQAGSIMDYLSFARNYISKCEVLYGEEEVEAVLDSCHSLQYHGINTYKHKVVSRKQKNEAAIDEEVFVLNPSFARLLDKEVKAPKKTDQMVRPGLNKDNLLYFIEKHSPTLPEWKREIIRIVRTIAQYFYPQMMTKVLNEGYASYTHYRLMEKLHHRGLISDGSWMEFALSHTNVVAQSGVAYGQFRGWNPYALGYAIFQDIERMCVAPTKEDRYYFPYLVGRDPIEATTEAMKDYNDSGFISQYLSPKVMRDFKMFSIYDPSEEDKHFRIEAVTDEQGYNRIRQHLANQYERNYSIPSLEVVGANLHDDRTLVLKYIPYRERTLADNSKHKMIKHLETLWGYKVVIE